MPSVSYRLASWPEYAGLLGATDGFLDRRQLRNSHAASGPFQSLMASSTGLLLMLGNTPLRLCPLDIWQRTMTTRKCPPPGREPSSDLGWASQCFFRGAETEMGDDFLPSIKEMTSLLQTISSVVTEHFAPVSLFV